MHKVRFNYVELITLLKEVENVLNNRPLSYVYYEDLEEPLTPNKLIYGRNLNVTVNDTSIITDDTVGIHERLDNVQLLIRSFWNIWRKDYLVNLREAHQKRYKRTRHSIDPSVDDLVLVHDEKLKRGCWKMGRVQSLKISSDGKCRSAQVITMNNGKRIILERPVNLLYPIEEAVSNFVPENGTS